MALAIRDRAPALLIAASLAVAGAGNSAQAQTITSTQQLSFGAFAAGSGGTVTITPQGARTATGDVTLMTSGQLSLGNSASFEVSGSANAAYQITLPADNQVTLAGSQGGSMTLSSFRSSPSPGGQLSSLGTQTLYIGATLGVGGGQSPGTYSGSFNVTVVFQ